MVFYIFTIEVWARFAFKLPVAFLWERLLCKFPIWPLTYAKCSFMDAIDDVVFQRVWLAF